MFPYRLVLFSLAVAVQTLLGQELRVEYPEIRLADEKVLTHPRVESFNGLGFCIAHDKGIEVFVRWEIMPAKWQKAFPRDPQKALALADKAQAVELKHPLPPIDLKKPTGHVIQTIAPENPVNSSKGEKSIPYKRTYMRSELDEMQRQHLPADDLISQFGTPDSTETTTAWHYLLKVPLKAERWIYHNLTRDPASQTVDAKTVVVVAEISDGKKFIYDVQYN